MKYFKTIKNSLRLLAPQY